MVNYNKKTKVTASVFGVLLGLAGIINHGIFEVFQGNSTTNGFFIEAISESHRFWVHGTEGAFTLIPNFLIIKFRNEKRKKNNDPKNIPGET